MSNEKEKTVHEQDGMKITVTRDPELTASYNTGYCSIAWQQIKGRTIEDIYYENVYFDRDGKWDIDTTSVVITLEKVDYSPIVTLIVQSDPEGNPGGYLAQMTSEGSYRNQTEGDRHLKNLGMDPKQYA
jgi:hypothetical protein